MVIQIVNVKTIANIRHPMSYSSIDVLGQVVGNTTYNYDIVVINPGTIPIDPDSFTNHIINFPISDLKKFIFYNTDNVKRK